MKIHCKRCGFYLGEVLSGSKLHKDIVYLCISCHVLFKTYEDLKAYEDGVGKGGKSSDLDIPDFLKGLMNGGKK